MRRPPGSALALVPLLVACGGESSELPPPGWQLEGAATLELVFEPEEPMRATDLAFHPDRPNELWVVHRLDPPEGPCNEEEPDIDMCRQYIGTVAIQWDGTQPSSAWERRSDPNAWHFMRLPPGLAFGNNGTFATCGEWRTGNFDDGEADFIGPTLFSSDLDIFAWDPGEGLNGSHLDMLHGSPWCVGIAHEIDNVYWVFNGQSGTLDRYDFNEDHGPGAEDHSDGEIWHHRIPGLSRVPFVPSHLVHDPIAQALFVADTAGARLLRIDPSTATKVDDYTPNYDGVAVNEVMEGATVTELAGPDALTPPSGVARHRGVTFVSDHATSELLAFDADGTVAARFDTGLPTGSLAGVAVGPDELVYVADLITGRAYRVVPP